jgi:hypothetical protein
VVDVLVDVELDGLVDVELDGLVDVEVRLVVVRVVCDVVG